MELATRTWRLSPSASIVGASTTGRKTALHRRSAKLACFPSPSCWRLLSQNSVAARCPPSLIVAAKTPEDPASKLNISKLNTSPAADAKDSIKTTPTLTEGQPVKGEVSKKVSVPPATREQVLKACVYTSAAFAAAGLAIRQGSHWAVEQNYSVPDCYVEMPYNFAVWHLGATAGTVFLIASLRQQLLSSWPEFSQSSRQSIKQVLSPLGLDDYLIVSFLPGVSEELFFRGAILPLVGADWRGVIVAGLAFGILHISGGRNAAFAAWASFVGVVYGFAAIYTTDLSVPMVAHAVANLVAAYVWRIDEDRRLNSK